MLHGEKGREVLEEVSPVQKSKRQTRLISYKRVKRKVIKKEKIEEVSLLRKS